MEQDQTYYGKGVDHSVSQTHAWRTAKNSCSYMLHLIQPNHKILDIGCGPGTITIDIGKNYLGDGGEITGIEPSKELIDECIKSTPTELSHRIKFVEASALQLPFPDNSFDVVHCHQVLLHLPDPLRALKEMRRVVKKGGIVCSRDADLDTTLAYPEQYNKWIHFSFNGKIGSTTKFKFGRTLRELSLAAGFESSNIKTSNSHWSYSSDDERQWFGDMFIKRFSNSTDTYDEDQEKDQQCKEKIVDAWKGWRDDPNGWFLMVHFEIVCQK